MPYEYYALSEGETISVAYFFLLFSLISICLFLRSKAIRYLLLKSSVLSLLVPALDSNAAINSSNCFLTLPTK